ncbi:hypothetical protein M413DRAFT_441238 [Hebeloma cylindrosporum]|uniref:Uncharacterized protein n=1 Tax=Hebeloma cylindrosporum TaxID=76867 RepID=A0A0C3CQ12_HEBCY|nr:hypothetical protein M413DRAFT_441238 [Hebeloma cylindrosporum h7]
MATDFEDRLLPVEVIEATDFDAFVTETLSRVSRDDDSSKIDQKVVRQCINMASSFLLTDTTMNPGRGVATWFSGFSNLVDLIMVLDKRDELEIETLSAASRACSECWIAAGSWAGLIECRGRVEELAKKLKDILDHNKRTYRGSF